MSKSAHSVKLRPYANNDLNNLSYSDGDVVYDKTNGTLRVMNGETAGGTLLATRAYVLSNSSGSGTVNSGLAGKLAYYPSTGTAVDDLSNVGWSGSTLNVSGSINVTGQKNYVRFHWDTLADLNNEVSPVTWHGMLAHVHETGRVYFAHSGAWTPLANLSDVTVASIQAGTNVTVSSSAGVYTINATGGSGGGITLEEAQDGTASLFSNGTQTGISFSYNDAGNALSATVGTVALGTGTSGNYVASVQNGTGITGGSAGSAGAALTLGIDTAIVSTLTGAQTLTNKTISGASNTITNIGNSALTNSSITINGSSVSLGGTITVSSASDLNGLTDVTITTPSTGQVLKYNGSAWINNAEASASNLDGLTDVTITTPSTGQVLKYNGTTWINDADATAGGAGAGTVTTVSVISANGFAGTVATASSTPTITITTSITGVLKGNATAVSAAVSGTDYAPGTSALITGIVKSTTTTGALSIAVAGTDYQAPVGTISGIVKGNGANALTAATAGTDYQAPVSATGILKSSGVSGNVSAATAGTDYQAAISATGLLKSNGTSGNVSAATAGTDYQAPITLTTTGSSGAATFTSGTLNIPQYASGATAFSGLSDATSAALTLDEIYLQATTRLTVTASGSSAYLFDQYAGNNPTIYAISGTTIAFDLSNGLSSHPFLIRFSGANYDTGLTHVTSAGVVTTGSSAQGKTSGTLYWKIPAGISGAYGYLCSNHGGMAGVITINPATITATSLSLGNVTNESKATMFASPSFTGTIALGTDQTDYVAAIGGGGTARLETAGGTANSNLAFSTKGTGSVYFWRGGYGGTESMRIDGDGKIYIGTATNVNSGAMIVQQAANGTGITVNGVNNTSGAVFMYFTEAGANCGYIQRVGTTGSVVYSTSSDYRLKENIAPMAGALATVAKLKPVTYNWKAGGSSQGFIAHELQEVIPDAVTGIKDQLNEDGSINSQGIDQSRIVATLTAAIQEQQAIIESLTARLTAVESR